jgi:hypothetical protein
MHIAINLLTQLFKLTGRKKWLVALSAIVILAFIPLTMIPQIMIAVIAVAYVAAQTFLDIKGTNTVHVDEEAPADNDFLSGLLDAVASMSAPEPKPSPKRTRAATGAVNKSDG